MLLLYGYLDHLGLYDVQCRASFRSTSAQLRAPYLEVVGACRQSGSPRAFKGCFRIGFTSLRFRGVGFRGCAN